MDDSELLLALSEAINADLELRRVLQTVTDISTRLSGARFGAFFYNARDERGELYRLHVLSGADPEAFARMPAPRITELFAPTFSGQETVRVADLAATGRGGTVPRGHVPVRSYLATPVVGRAGEVIGSLLFGHPQPGVFDERSERLVRIVAAHAAVAVENARLFEAEQAARREAEQTAQRLRLLHTITARLAAALTVGDAVDAVMETAAASLDAQAAAVYLADPGGRLTVAPGHTRGILDDVVPGWPDLPLDASTPAGTSVLTRQPVAAESATELTERFPAVAGYHVNRVGAVLSAPVQAGDEVHGALVMTWDAPRRIERGDVDLAVAAAVQLAQAMERARLYEAELAARTDLSRSVASLTAVSSTLQRSLLPRAVPAVPQVEVAVRYLPSGDDVEVGGDWYDVVPTPHGSTVFVVGDVQGHSIAAAAVMGQLRIALHAYLSEGHEPDVALARANKVLIASDPSVLVTCCLAELDPDGGRLRVVRAGHPLPLLRTAGGETLELQAAGGLPLGVDAESTWPVTEARMTAGDRLVLYTDGLVERPDLDLTDGVAALVKAVDAATGGAQDAADGLLSAVGLGLTDDVALLVCDFAGPPGDQRTAVMELGSDLRGVAAARRFTARTLAEWGLPELSDVAVLLVSEMTTNALVHTGGTATLDLRLEGGRFRLTVTDTHPRAPQPRSAELSATNGRGLMLVDALSAAWGVEPNVPGKCVWAELHADPQAEDDTRPIGLAG